MATWLAPYTGNYYKVQFLWNWQDNGWSDTFYYANANNVPGGTWTDVQVASSALGNAINDSHGKDVRLRAVRMSSIGTTPYLGGTIQQTRLRSAFVLNIGPVLETQPPVDSQIGWLFTLTSVQEGYNRPWIAKGWAARYVQAGIEGGGYTRVLTPAAVTKKNNIRDVLTGLTKTGPSGDFAGDWGMLARDKNPATVTKFVVADIRLDDNGKTLQYRVAKADYDVIKTAKKVQVMNARARCATGLSGTFTILGAESDPDFPLDWWIITDKRTTCGTIGDIITTGTINAKQWGIWGFADMLAVELRNRDSGGPFLHTRGAARKKVC